MLGSLARWLRLLGFDTLYCDNWSDDDILKATGTRILLTRDKQLLSRAQARRLTAINPGHRSIANQLLHLSEQLDISFEADPARCRCPHCNHPLIRASKVQVCDRVPAGSLRRYAEFWECSNPECRHIYWQGRHWQRIKQTLAETNSESSGRKPTS
jgi:uncharacterized protein with PIN domain